MSAETRVTLRCDSCHKGAGCRCNTPPAATVEDARRHAAEHLGWTAPLRRRRLVDLCPNCQRDGERP